MGTDPRANPIAWRWEENLKDALKQLKGMEYDKSEVEALVEEVFD